MLFGPMTVAENLALGAHARPRATAESPRTLAARARAVPGARRARVRSRPARCPAASSRCSRSAGRSCRARGCCCSTSRRWAWRPRSSPTIFAALDALRADGLTILLVEQDAQPRAQARRPGIRDAHGPRRAGRARAAELLANDDVRLIYLGAWHGKERERAMHDLEPRIRDDGPRASSRELQLRRLQSTVAWVYERVPYYREQLDARGVKPTRHPRRSTTCATAPVHGQDGAARHVPVRHVRRAARAGRARALARRARPASRSSSATRRATSTPGRELTARIASRGGRAPRRPRADGVPLRHVHGRLGHALRHRARRRDRHPGGQRATPSATS